jgi:hypothetical protein
MPSLNGYSADLLTNDAVQTWGGFTVQGVSAGVLNFALFARMESRFFSRPRLRQNDISAARYKP